MCTGKVDGNELKRVWEPSVVRALFGTGRLVWNEDKY
jgi:hypothetical protein